VRGNKCTRTVCNNDHDKNDQPVEKLTTNIWLK